MINSIGITYELFNNIQSKTKQMTDTLPFAIVIA